MNEWITDRKPEPGSIAQVFVTRDHKAIIEYACCVHPGEPWKHIDFPLPYVNPKRFIITQRSDGTFQVFKASEPNLVKLYASAIPTVEAAEQIAAIYEEEML